MPEQTSQPSASPSSGGKTTSAKKSSTKKSATKKSAKKTKAQPGNQFQQPVAVQGVTPAQSTHEQRIKGEHPTTNEPRLHDMGVLHQKNSPSRVGFEHLTIGGNSPAAGTVSPSAKLASPKQVKKAAKGKKAKAH